MGADWSQQGCLKISKEQGLIERNELKFDTEYSFEKSRHRLYMLDTPIQLLTDTWQAIATIIITEITVGNNKTKGKFKVLKIYSDEEVEKVSATLIPYYQFREQ